MVLGRLIAALDRPLDAASTGLFRVLFSALMLGSTLRFFAHGWVHDDYLIPKHFFSYWGFAWVRPWAGHGMYLHYALLALAAFCMLLGFAYRYAAFVFAIAFSYAHFCDKANYLNHYYLVSLLGCLLALLPLDRRFSVRVFRRPEERRTQIRAWALYLLRFQVGVVYVFGGIGKLGSDWLMRAEPLRIWLAANEELPLLGRFLLEPWAGLCFSWCGALFDLSIVPLLLWRATRAPAYAVLVFFHVLTALLFNIGMFPWIMIVSSTLFFEPSWPLDLARRLGRKTAAAESGVAGGPLGSGARGAALAYALLQVSLPLRSALYSGNTLWTEEGFRFAWKVMLIEKAGALEYKVVDAAGRVQFVSPREYLTPFQTRMTATQPDMILELAHWIAADFAARGQGSVRVYADSEVTFNGRAHARLVDPEVDLARESDTLREKHWILPAPETAPLF